MLWFGGFGSIFQHDKLLAFFPTFTCAAAAGLLKQAPSPLFANPDMISGLPDVPSMCVYIARKLRAKVEEPSYGCLIASLAWWVGKSSNLIVCEKKRSE